MFHLLISLPVFYLSVNLHSGRSSLKVLEFLHCTLSLAVQCTIIGPVLCALDGRALCVCGFVGLLPR